MPYDSRLTFAVASIIFILTIIKQSCHFLAVVDLLIQNSAKNCCSVCLTYTRVSTTIITTNNHHQPTKQPPSHTKKKEKNAHQTSPPRPRGSPLDPRPPPPPPNLRRNRGARNLRPPSRIHRRPGTHHHPLRLRNPLSNTNPNLHNTNNKPRRLRVSNRHPPPRIPANPDPQRGTKLLPRDRNRNSAQRLFVGRRRAFLPLGRHVRLLHRRGVSPKPIHGAGRRGGRVYCDWRCDGDEAGAYDACFCAGGVFCCSYRERDDNKYDDGDFDEFQ
ncbi:hypothetical protein B0T19DRAFT_458607 [Cercophora scortea]|uniref:Uncharacterized protein n=1 Tax=Cercophora scortea TaxID=314031 RepID=A0AAE0MJH1_9PEZI|nr:hypothetical protein B0T19DRAFT_458607 [Cercophora scortea]